MFDDFDGALGSAPNPALWDASEGGAFNAVLLTKRPENVSLDGNGNLAITLRRERVPGYTKFPFTGGRVKTYGHFDFTDGEVRARLKFPRAEGVHATFFLMGLDWLKVGTAAAGEIDIAECFSSVAGSGMHGPGYQKLAGWPIDDQWHEYWCRRETDRITIGVDDQPAHVTWTPASLPKGKTWIYNDRPMFIAIECWTGGAAVPDVATTLPARLLVDWVRHTPLGDDVTKEQYDALVKSVADVAEDVRQIRAQLGPSLTGWPSLGTNAKDEQLTWRDAFGGMKADVAAIKKKLLG